jgi:CDP-diacylglycerol--glycerol-3-phosphate 3-phosphatidyltransferase
MLTFNRVVAAPLLITLLWFNERELFTWFLLISYCTDMIDGQLARRLKITSARGSQLDSLGDQITFVIGLIGLLVFETDFMKENGILIIIAFTPYIIQMLLAYSKYGKATAFHTYLAKLSAIVQGVFILWALFFGADYVLFYSMIVIGILETIEEIALIFMYNKWASDVKGVYWALHDKRRLKKKKT